MNSTAGIYTDLVMAIIADETIIHGIEDWLNSVFHNVLYVCLQSVLNYIFFS